MKGKKLCELEDILPSGWSIFNPLNFKTPDCIDGRCLVKVEETFFRNYRSVEIL